MKKVLLSFVFAVSVFLCMSLTVNAAAKDFEYQLNENGGITITKYTGFESNVEIPDEIDGYSVNVIGDSAFENCSDVKTLKLPDSIEIIERGAFKNCTNLKTIELPDSLTTIGYKSFAYCSSLDEIDFPHSLTTIETEAFICTALREIYLPPSVKKILSYAFYGCTDLEKVTIDTVAEFKGSDYGAFGNCPKLQTAGPIGGGYDIEFSWNSVVPAEVFVGCNSLKSVVIPAEITEVGKSAFKNCTKLTDVYFYGDLPSFGTDYEPVFENTSGQLTLHYLNGAFGFTSPETMISNGDVYYAESFTVKDYVIHWGREAINYVIENKLVDIISENEFQPDAVLTKKTFIEALAKISEVKSDYFQWALDAGLLKDDGNGNYSENAPVNREQMCVIVENYLVSLNHNLNELKTVAKNTFADDNDISESAKESVYNMQELGIIVGRPQNIFDSKALATRAEGASVIHKLALLLDK
ncbi:MAG: leucine-rich repeat domain-containing protein [Ruminococcaceae bacterium]|nr:leucine-rich repeat domain-containing protein [Oscillospiraceae bacterium]